jgi:hypothetical protein
LLQCCLKQFEEHIMENQLAFCSSKINIQKTKICMFRVLFWLLVCFLICNVFLCFSMKCEYLNKYQCESMFLSCYFSEIKTFFPRKIITIILQKKKMRFLIFISLLIAFGCCEHDWSWMDCHYGKKQILIIIWKFLIVVRRRL